MSKWIECDNVTALQKKMDGCDIAMYVWNHNGTTTDEYKTMPNGWWNFDPEEKYRYKEKPQFKDGEMVLSWDDNNNFLVGKYGDWIAEKWAKTIPYQSEVVEAEKTVFMSAPDRELIEGMRLSAIVQDLLGSDKKGRFLIMRIPDEKSN